MKAVIWGWTGHCNFGDDVMLNVNFKLLKDHGLTELYIIQKGDFINDKLKCLEDTKITLLDNKLSLKNIRMIINASRGAKFLIFGGGNIFENVKSILSRMLIGLIFKFFIKNANSKIIAVGVSTSNITVNKNKSLLKLMLSLFDNVYFRDENSYSKFKMTTSKLIPDLAYFYDTNTEKKLSKKTYRLGVSIARASLDKYPSEYILNYITDIRNQCIKSTSRKVELVFFDFCSDDQFSDKICYDLFSVLFDEIVTYDGDLSIFENSIASCNLFIASRLHSQIICDVFSIPYKTLSYSDKNDYIPISNFSLDKNDPANLKNLSDEIDMQIIKDVYA
jgi:polysaccharide pyruvyl transferase WcaK-like protein